MIKYRVLSVCSFRTILILIGFQFISVFANAQTIGGMRPSDDFDGDGIINSIDLDDDNDGVLDVTEQYCLTYNAVTDFYGPNYWKSISWTGGAYTAVYPNATPNLYIDGNLTNGVEVFRPGTTANPIAGDDFTSTPIIFTLNTAVPIHADGFSIVNDYGASGDNILKADIKLFSGTGSNTILLGTETVDNMADVSTTTRYAFSKGYDNISSIQILVYKTLPAGTQPANGMQLGELGLYSNAGTFCMDIDTDGDGIPNRLDLDSDGDGCSDAIESGSSATATSIIVCPTGTDTNSNGILNVYESGTAGSINYTSKYTPYALSKNLAACRDTDGDGILDDVDLDDDNDGILDAVESPNCFYSANEWHFGNRPNITVTSGLTMVSPQNRPQNLVDGKNSGVSYDVRMETTTTLVNALGAGKEVYKFNMQIPVKLSKVYLGYTGIYSHFNDGTKLILRGSNDGLNWTFLSGTGTSTSTAEVSYDATINSNSATETSTIYPYPATTQYGTSANIFSVTQNTAKYLYYDIFWSSGGGINNTGYANEVYFDVASDYLPSANPKSTCNSDTDGDGIMNHQDLDSDGDSCPDAKEANITATLTSASVINLAGATIASGTTTTTIQNAIVAGTGISTFGNNGFVNSLETSSESGIYSGTYNYTYANNKTLSNCLDSDGDGTPDVFDLDDDNDGVLDIVECPVPGVKPLLSRFDIASGASMTQTFNGFPDELWIDIWTLDNNFNLKVNGTDITNVSELNFAPMSSSTVYTVPYTDVVSADGTPIYPSGSVWTYPNTAKYPLIRVKISNNGYSKIYGYDFVNGTGNYKELVLVNAVYQNVPINLSGSNTILLGQDNTYAPSYLNAEFNTYSSAGFCDTDGDGVENRLDLDSDGDGCSDAYEAKTTTNSSSNYKFTSSNNSADFGANGFYNSLETITDNGFYKTNYTYDFAIDPAIKSCLDSDSDGVPDIYDLDDDNDGILDAVESPTCFYNLTELSKPASVSSDLKLYDATSTYAITNSIDGLNSTYSAFKAGQYLTDKEILKYTANGLIAINSITLNLDFRAISTDVNSTFKLQGSDDNVLWDDLSNAPISSTITVFPATLVLNNDLQPTKKYKYFRIFGVAGTNNYGGIAEATFNLASTTRSSSNPKLTCTNDTDGDGIPNQLDLDSDGDGCPDAKEAGVIGTLTTGTIVNLTTPSGTATSTSTGVANAVAAGTYSTNGFADALETATESGLYSGAYFYDNAIIKTLNFCTDTDGDGVPDLIDIDDDNDGILDAIESPNCFYTSADLSQPTNISTELTMYSTYSIDKAIDNDPAVSSSAFYPNQNWIGKALFNFNVLTQVPITGVNLNLINWSLSNASTANTFKLQGSSDNQIWTDLSTPISSIVSTGTLNIPNTLATNTKFKYFRIIGVAGVGYYGGVADIKLVIPSSFVQSQYTKPTCLLSDLDGDNLPNYLDLDSDGDGCSDALEAGTTSSTTANFKFTGSNTDFGANGFYNTLEKTNAESNLYKSFYTYYYANDATINVCTDTDGDGVNDLLDLDDDNDGILDYVEQSCTGSNMSKSDITLSSAVNWYFQNAPNGLNALFDGSLIQQIYPTETSISNKTVFQFNFLKPKVLNLIELANVANQTPFIAGGTYKIQGSNDEGASWSDIISSQAVANTSPILATTNSIKFDMPLNYKAFLYYRIYAISMTGQANWSTEVYFREVKCLDIDTDGDRISNRLDLDSDGDGCPDAVEAGTTAITSSGVAISAKLTTSVIPAPYGANGFANGLETSSESGVYTSTYKYNYALDATINACRDSDNDGVPDVLDLDDDNDGVLDTNEQTNCVTYGIDLSTLTFNGTAITAKTLNSITTAGGDVWKSSYSDQNLKLPISLKFKHTSTTGYEMFGLIPITTSQVLNNYNDLAYKFYGQNNVTYGYFTTAWDFGPITILPTDILSIDISSTGYVTAAINGVTKKAFQGTVSDYKIDLSSYRISSISDIILTDATHPAQLSCTELDTDGDGISNRLDLDSDGDGCPDAVEAGTTAITSSGVASSAKLTTSVIPAPYGNNGFANGLETTTESGLYSGTYTYNYATDATISACKDTDGDGVPDISDLDDDNDGVLDYIECTCKSAGTTSPVIAPSAIATVPVNVFELSSWGSHSYLAYDGSGLSATPTTEASLSTITHSSPTLISNAAYTSDNTSVTNDWLFTLPAVSDIKGIAMWIPGSNAYGGGDAPMKKFEISWINCEGKTKSKIFDLGTPSANVKLLYFDEPIMSVSSIKMHVLEVWYDKEMDQGVGNGWEILDAANVLGAFNITLGEIRFIGQVGPYKILKCNMDSDGDGIPNNIDLDSDGDGCPDAVEAGTTAITSSGVASSAKLTTSVIPAPYGNNGFANGLETTTESGLYSGTYTYNYATDATISACKDTDGDGVPDLSDLDDDNDGVLDIIEDGTCANLNINGGLNWKYWNINKTLTNHDLLPMSGRGGTSAPNLFPVVDVYGLPDFSITPTSTGTMTTWIAPTGTDNTTIDALRFEGYMHFPDVIIGKAVSVRVTPAGGAQAAAAWVISKDANPKNWIDPTSASGEPLLDMQNTTGLTNPSTLWTGAPVGFVVENNYGNNTATPIPIDRRTPINWKANVVANPNGHYISFWIADPLVAWNIFNFQYSIDGTTWVNMPMSAFGSTPPTGCFALDTDGDGIPNRLDLDSDGDGCPDAVEAGTTAITSSGVAISAKLTTSVIPAPYGNNGFANGLETTTESGLYSGTYTYNYATDATINACTDSDNDGVPDVFDLDDDNDGVLDTAECTAALMIESNPANLGQVSRKSWTLTAYDEAANNGYAGTTFGGVRSEATNIVYGEVKLPSASSPATIVQEAISSLDFPSLDKGTIVYREVFVKIPETSAFKTASQINFRIAYPSTIWNTGMLYISHKGNSITTPIQGGGGNSSLLLTNNRDDLKLVSQAKYSTVQAYQGGTFVVSSANAGKWIRMAIAIHDGMNNEQSAVQYTLGSSSTWLPVDVANGFQFAATNFDNSLDEKSLICDTDGDGIPNSLDLDSDGDGCPDAVEAGTVYISTSGVSTSAKLSTSIIPAPYGNNGFANGLETTSESGVYTGTYTYSFATNATLNACTDTDGDGVPDILDLDDDNDGVLDVKECEIYSNSFVTGSGGNTNTVSGWTVGGTYSAAPWTSATGRVYLGANGLEFRRDYSTTTTITKDYTNLPAKTTLNLTDVYWYNTATTGIATTGILNIKLNGVTYATINTGTLQTDAPSIITSNGATTSINALPIINATGTMSSKTNVSITFPNTALATGTLLFEFVASTSTGDVDDIGFGSLNISNCNLDTDGDGVPNRLDLDSDGDGCPDAKESGVNGTLTSGSVQNGTGGVVTTTNTISNAIAAGPYGANGLANGVETSTESGVVTYTSTYATNALIKDSVAPTISVQPLNKTVFVGSAVVLTVTAGTSPANRSLTYQWYKSGVAIAGATTATYSLTISATSANVADYYCAVGFVNSCLTTNTNTINVTVLSNPVGLTACQDASAVLTSIKTGTNSVTYQWKKVATNLVNGVNVTGATTATVGLTNLALGDAGNYVLVATDAYGNTINSVAGTITITNNTKYVLPTTYTTCATTSTINLTSAVYTGTTGATSTKWQRSLDGGASWVDVTSSLDASITYTNMTTGTLGITASSLNASAALNGYQYRLVTSNATCTNYSNIETITIGSAPVITAQPSNSLLCNSFSTSFTAAATGVGLSYQWQTRPAGNGAWTNITAANANTIDAGVVYSNYATATLNLSAAPASENNNQYQVVFTNSCGTVISTTAILNPTVVTPTLTGANVSVCSGVPVTLTANSSTASTTYQWYLGGVAIGGATTASFNPTASGNYSVIAAATGYCSSATASGTVTINPLPTVTIAEGSIISLTTGGSLQLTATASPGGTSSYTYQWFKDNILTALSETSNVLTLNSAAQVGSYIVKATNITNGCTANSASSIITSIPDASANGSTTFCQGGSVKLSISLTSSQIAQWQVSTYSGSTWSSFQNTSITPITSSSISTITVVAPGRYQAVVTDNLFSGGLSGTSKYIEVIVNPLPTATITNSVSGTICAGSNAILTASSSALTPTYQWFESGNLITGATSSTYTATSTGVYSLNIKDGNSCVAGSLTSTVNVASPPTAPNLTATNGIICANTSADLTIYQPQAVTGVTYEWHTVSANPTSADLVAKPSAIATAGTYYLYAKNSSAGCYSTASVAYTLTIKSVADVTLTSANSPTYLINDFATALKASTTNPTFSLRWYAAATGGVALTTPLLPATNRAGVTNYYVEQYDSLTFCSSAIRTQATVTVKPLAPTVANVTYCQNATAIALTATGSTGATFKWFESNGTALAAAPTPSTTSVGSTTYYVSQVVNTVESAVATITVTVNTATATPTFITGNTTVTALSSQNYSVTNVANTTYTWVLPSFMSGNSSTNSIVTSVNTSGTGSLSVIATGANGCPSSPSTISLITANPYVAAAPTTSSITYVVGDANIPTTTTSLISTPVTGGTLNYYTSNTLGSASSASQSMPTTPGIYTYYVSQTVNGVESVLVPYTVTIKPAAPIVASVNYCQNEVAVALTATGTSLKWYTASIGGTLTTTAPTPATGTATTTSYFVSQTVGGVESDRIALVVTINPTPASPSVINGLTSVIAASAGTYSVTNVAGVTYNWTLPADWSGTSTTNSINITVGASGGQILITALEGACTSPATSLTVDILGITNPPITTDITFVTGSTPSSIVSTTTSLITGTASSTLNFYTSNITGTTSTMSQTTPSTPGVYTYYVSQTENGIESILVPYTITIKPMAPPINTNTGIVGNKISYCKNATATALTATTSSGGILKWYTTATGGLGATTISPPSTSIVGTTNFYVSQTVNGVESDRVQIIVSVNDIPTATVATVNAQPTCTVTSGSILVTAPLGTGYTYSVDGTTYSNTTLFTGLPSGNYYVTAQNAAGCIGVPATVIINPAVTPPLAPVVAEVQPTCAIRTGVISVTVKNNTDNYSIDGGLSYQLSNVFSNVVSGSYSVTVKNASGCVSTASVAIIDIAPAIPSQPSISSSSSGSICAGTAVTLTSSATTGNQWFKEGVLIAGAIQQNFEPSVSGNYTVVVTNATGCSSIASPIENVAFYPLPIPEITSSASLSFSNCSATTITLSATNSNTTTGNSYQWYLNGNSINVNGNNVTYNATQAGNYSVAITNNGCTATSSITKVLSAPSLNAPNAAYCAGTTAAITITGIGSGYTSPTYQWQFSTDGGMSYINAIGTGTNSLTYIASAAGKYQLLVNDNTGHGIVTATSCPIQVTEYASPSVTITASSTAECVGTPITLNANVTAGTASYTYQWLNTSNIIAGAISTSYTTTIAGTYGLKIIDANGCQATASPSAINFNLIPAKPTVIITNPTCAVATGTISITAPLGVGYTYSIDGTNYTNTTGLFTGVLPGTYSVTAKSASGCNSLATSATIAPALVVPNINGATITGNTFVVANSLNTYSIAGVISATSYTWTVPAYWSGASTTNSIIIKVDASVGSISVVANSATCSSAPITKIIDLSNTTPDIAVTDINVPVTGNLSTNDLVPPIATSSSAGTTYGQPGTNTSNPTGATILVNTDGTYSFTATVPGKYVYYVPVCGPNQTSGCPLTPLEITVLEPIAPLDKPVANNDQATTSTATPVTVNILANDAAGNPGGTLNTSSVTVANVAKHGSVIVNSDGTITYTPVTGFVGSDSVTYRVCDNSLPTPLCQTAVVYFTVTAPAAPAVTVAVDDYATVTGSANGTSIVNGNVLNNDTNTAGGTLTATVVTGPTSAQGIFTLNANGTYSFTPAPGFSGPVSVVYTACTSAGICETATLHILVDPAPVINPDESVTSINTPVSGALATNDLVLVGTTYGQPATNPNNPSGGTIIVQPDGTYTFTGTAPGKYTYYIPTCAPGQTTNCPLIPLEITVVDPSLLTNPPIVNNDIAITTAGSSVTVNVLSNDKGGNIGGAIVATSETITVAPTHGTAVINSDGTITYTPTAGFVGTDSLTYRVCDNTSPTPICNTAIVYFTVKPVSALPSTVAIDDYASVVANVNGTISVTGSVLSNDANTAGTTLTASIVSGATAAEGVFTMNANGTYTFTPAPGFTGPVDIIYTACTGSTPPVCATATLHILVEPAPVINPDVNATDINVPVSGSLFTNDHVVTGTTYGQPASNINNPAGATITVNTDGTYTFTASTPGTYIYYVPVCAPGQTSGCPLSPIEITVLDPNLTTNPPITNNDFATTPAGASVTVNVLSNDKAGNMGGAIIASSETITGAPTHGTAIVNSNGTITYTPVAGFVGTDSLTYRVCDNTSPTPICNIAVVYFTVAASNAPASTTALDDMVLVFANHTTTGNVLTNDFNTSGATLTAALVSGPTTTQGTIVFNSDGSYVFTPSPGYTGPIDITYTACTGATPPICATATLHILVEPNPITITVIAPDVNVTDINIPVTGSLATNDELVPGTTYRQPADNPNNPAGGIITVSPNGTYTFTATIPGTYIYYVPVCATGQTTGCPLSPIEITVLDPLANNNPPVANTDMATLPTGTAATVNVLANDKSGNVGSILNPSSVTIAAQPAHGVVVVNSDGTIKYTPTIGFVGTDSVLYSVCDNTSPTPICKTAVVYFTVVAANAPEITTAVDDYATVVATISGSNSISGTVLTNDINSLTSTLTVTQHSTPLASQGVLLFNADGTYTFTPAKGFNGPVDITYTACSVSGECASATLHILVSPALITPIDIAVTDINVPVTSSVAINDVVPAGTTYSTPIASSSNPTGATLTMSPSGTYTFTATTPGKYIYYVPTCAPGQATGCPLVPLEITVLDPLSSTNKPVVNNDIATTLIGTPTTVNVLANDKAGNIGGTLVISSETITIAPTHGTAVVNSDGTITFTPAAGFIGTDSLTYSVCDNATPVNCQTAIVYFTVTPLAVNPSTIGNEDFVKTIAGANASGNVLTNDLNTGVLSSINTLTATLVTGPTTAQGALVFNADGSYIFTQAPGFTGPLEVIYKVCGGTPTTCANATLHILVEPYFKLQNDTATQTVDRLISGNLATNDVAPNASYGVPFAGANNLTGATFTLNSNGKYTFIATKPGIYTYKYPVCGQGQTSNCDSAIAVFNITYLPQGLINLKYPTLLQADSVHLVFNFTEGVGPFKIIVLNSLSKQLDTIFNVRDGSDILVAPRKDDTKYTLISITDSNNIVRDFKLTKDTALLNILKPQIVLTLKADLPTKLPDNSFKTSILMKIKNNGEIDLRNVQVNADLSNVFPPDMKYTLDSVRVTRGQAKLNPMYNGFGFKSKTSYTTRVENGFTIKYKTFATLSGSDLFDYGVNLNINEESDVVFYLTIIPGKIMDPLVLQFTGSGDGLLTQLDGLKSMEPTTSISHDNSNVAAHPSLTNVGTPLPTYIPLFLVNEIGASLQGSKADTVVGGYVFHYSTIIKNYSNSNLDSVYAYYNLRKAFPLPDTASIIGQPTIIGKNKLNVNYDGVNDTAILNGIGALKVGDSIIIKYDVFVKTDKAKYIWPSNLLVTGITTVGDLHVTDSSTNGLNPDPNFDFIPKEKLLTIVYVGYNPPVIPTVMNAIYNVGDSTNPKNIGGLIKTVPPNAIPTWCDANGISCYNSVPSLPTKPGVYIYCVKSLDTLTGLVSAPCVMDTVTMLPVVKVVNTTLMGNITTNPKTISHLVTKITPGSAPQWCDINGNNCTKVAPAMPTAPGKYVWCVKAIDSTTLLQSATCKMDTVTILNPYDVLDVTKLVRSISMNLDGSYFINFVINVQNKTNVKIDSVLIKDDLITTFKNNKGYEIVSIVTSGKLVKNNGYDGVASIDLVTNSSSLDPNKTDSVLLSVLVHSADISGKYENSASVLGNTPYGKLNIVSNDPILNPNNYLNRVPTLFTVPKIDVIIPPSFSPNQNGFNDTWVILRPYGTKIGVKIFNRWGNEIYQDPDYKNNWRGKGVSNFLGQDIPEGTYFYVVEATDTMGSKKKFAGSLTIVR